ncbi:abasic site processing protein HMCES [Battus philenor]|uniref:abasic site processing protein HMCES n=1 Tax=Battus philenor TaxID=42288 RepID=UPI0035CF080F
MCGRTGLSLHKDQLRCACSYKGKDGSFIKPEWLHEHNDGKEYIPSYNIAPTDVTPILISSSNYKSVENARVIKPMMWGIIPPWHKGDYRSNDLNTINCRIENIRTSKLYNPILMNGGRCVIIVEGYYEWQTAIKRKVKQPFYIYKPQDEHVKIDDPDTWNNSYDSQNGWTGVKLLYLAGLYNIWQDKGTIMYSYSIITMDSNDTLNWLHHRMPAILDTEFEIEAWLDVDNVDPYIALSYLTPSTLLSWHQVSTSVNNTRYKSDDCNKRVSLEGKKSQSSITSWFTKVEKKKNTDEEKKGENPSKK